MSVVPKTNCTRFVQNAWKKNFCSNCYKTREEHELINNGLSSKVDKISMMLMTTAATKASVKSIIKVNLPSASNKKKKKSVNFPKEMSEIIGFDGGEWSGSDESDYEIDDVSSKKSEEVVYTEDENLQKLTKTNTEFNMNNGNLLGDPTVNIKKTFAALKLGTNQTDSSGNKQTLKISIEPFNNSTTNSNSNNNSTVNEPKTTLKMDKSKIFLPEPKNDKSTVVTTKAASVTISGNGIENTRPPQIAVVDEMTKKASSIDLLKEKSLLEEISETLMSKQIVVSRDNLSGKKPEEISNCDIISSDNNNKIKIKNPESIVTNIYTDAAALPLQKRTTIQRNTAILKDMEKPKIQQVIAKNSTDSDSDIEFCTISEYYDLVEAKNNIEMKSQVDHVDEDVTDSSPVQKKHLNFPTHYKPVIDEFKRRSESYNLVEKSFMSSKITSDGLIVTKTFDDEDSTESSFDDSSHDNDDNDKHSELENNDKTSATDYEIIELSEKSKNRYEPDGRSDPDGSSETSPQNVVDMHLKPKVPTKPLRVNNVKPYQKQNAKIIMQLQQVMNKDKSLSSDSLDPNNTKATAVTPVLKKNRAPEPPENSSKSSKNDGLMLTFKDLATMKHKFSSKTNTIQIKEPRSYPALNPKFRSLNNLNKSHETQEKIKSFENLNSPEMSQRQSLSLSQDSLIVDLANKTKKKKFSIKKMLRMGSNSKAEISSKSQQQYADIPTSPGDSEYYDTPQTKPRLIIIHPLDINNTGVEVVKSTKNISMMNDVTTTLDLPPLHPEVVKSEKKLPAIPPMKVIEKENVSSHQKGKAPSPLRENVKVYANLGEVRSSMAPKKPERTNSMKDREAKAQFQQRHQPVGSSDSAKQSDSDEKCKNEDSIITRPTIVNFDQQQHKIIVDTKNVGGDSMNSVSFSEMKKKLVEIENVSTRSKIELFENNTKKETTATTTRMPLIKPPPISFSPEFTSNTNSTTDNSKVTPLKINIDNNNYSPLKSQNQTPLSPMSPLSPNSTDELSSSVEMRRGGFSPIMPAVVTTRSNNKNVGSHDDNALYSPVHQDIGINRSSNTLSYCGSDLGESEIYSAYSYCGSEFGDVQNDINDLYQTPSKIRDNRTANRLKTRKGRSVVHKNLEDNYSAVIVANHEALAQVLDQLQQPSIVPPQLRPIVNSMNVRFDEFTISDSIGGLVVGKSVFHQAVWQNSVPCTLNLHQNSMVSGIYHGGATAALKSLTEFNDLVPNNFLPSMPTKIVQMMQATITVFPRLHVETLEMIGTNLKSRSQNETLLATESENSPQHSLLNQKSGKFGLCDDVHCREVAFIMLQLINALKLMQAKGYEEMPLSLSNIIMVREIDKDTQSRLCILQGLSSDSLKDEDEEMATLCQCALKVVKDFLPKTKLTSMLSHLLTQERADTLSKTKSVLEYVLWGPADVDIHGGLKERETILQRWMDLSRATALRSLAGRRFDINISDECHLFFLIRSNARTILDASQIISAYFDESKNTV